MRSIWLAGLLAVSCLFASTAASAAARLGASCDLAVLGASDSSGFLRFDNALREALEARNAGAVAALVSFPLQVNLASGGHQTLRDATAFRQQAAALLPVLRKAVMPQQPGQLFCNADGVMYADGTVWANPVGSGGAAPFRITSMNLPKGVSLGAAGTPVAARKPELACSTEKFRIEIEAMGDGKPLYRAWNLPHAASAVPAMELAGTMTREGTGVCSHRIWRFRNGNTDYVVTEPGCTDGGGVPAGAKAQLEVDIAGKPRLKAWCS